MEIKENLKKEIYGLTASQMSMLIWTCGVKALPFMSVRSGFSYWYDSCKKDYINSIFHALILDTRYVFYGIGNPEEARLAYQAVTRASKDITRLSQKTYLSGYKSAVAATKILKIVSDIAIDSFSVNTYLTCSEPTHGQFAEETISTLNKFLSAVEIAKEAVQEDNDRKDNLFGNIRTFNQGFNCEDIIAKDIQMIKNHKIEDISNNTDIYGELWSGFQTDLVKIGCKDWAEWYHDLFTNHFFISYEDLDEKLSIEKLNEKETKFDRLMISDDIEGKKKSVFLSYCSADDDIVDILDDKLQNQFRGKVTISRYKRDVKYRESFKQFMNSLKDHDFVITVISAKYLKSRACMYEVSELIAIPDFADRLLFIVLSDEDKEFYEVCPSDSIAANIYDSVGRNEYILYWKNKYEELYAQRSLIGGTTINKDLDDAIYETKKILDDDIQDFLSYIADARGIPFKDLLKTEFKDLTDVIINN